MRFPAPKFLDHHGIEAKPDMPGLSFHAALAMRCAVDALTVKVFSVGGDSKTGFNILATVS